MKKEGKYIYCIVSMSQERNFGPIGLKDEEVLTLGYNDLSMIVSSHPMNNLVVSRKNMISHEKVIEAVMKEFSSVLPVRFGTIASSADEARNLLDRRHREFKTALSNFDHKIELGVKGLWKNMKVIYKEITEENKEIKKMKARLQKDSRKKNTQAKIEIGKMVEEALARKKKKEALNIVEALAGPAVDYRLNKTIGDQVFLNASFLVDTGREKEFDNIMDDLSQDYKERVKFKYAGPLPIFNFVDIVIYPQEWEI